MKSKLILYFILVISLSSKGQEFSKEFGKLGNAEVNLAQYTKDLSAEAVVLFDMGESFFASTENGFEVVYERSTRIKILSEAGLKYAEFEIPYYREGNIYEKIYDFEGYTYNPVDGKLDKTAVKLSDAHDEKINESWILKKIAMPDVRVGSIIEIKYRLISQYVFNLRDWEFQWKIPVVFSQYKVKIIPFYSYSWLLQGANKFDVLESYEDKGFDRRFGHVSFRDMIHIYGMKDLPALKDEEFITTRQDYIIKLDFQLSQVNHLNGNVEKILTTWPSMLKGLISHSDFGKYIDKSQKLEKKLLNQAELSQMTNPEKFNYIVNYVKENFKWNEDSGKYATKSPNDFVKDKIGNTADINLFLTGLLRSSGIDANPVILSTRNHGKIKYDYPYNHFFNYVVVLADIDGKLVLTDATEINCANDRIPAKAINDKGLIVKNGEPQWVQLKSLIPSKAQSNILVEIKDDVVESKIVKSYTEYDALNIRNEIGENTDKIKEFINEEGYTIDEASISVSNAEKITEPYVLKYNIKTAIEKINDKIYVSPFLREPLESNPLKQNTRTYPVDMTYPIIRVYNSIITIPEGYQIDYIPQENEIKNSLFELSYKVVKENNRLNLILQYYFKTSEYSTENYDRIKSYFYEIVKKGNEKIVFIKT
jgi:hypothetical protein